MLILHKSKTDKHERPLMEALRTYSERFLSMLITRPYVDSPASVVNFERVMHGTRSLAK
jgi:hypothetical protein